jgi:hypothetical protein
MSTTKAPMRRCCLARSNTSALTVFAAARLSSTSARVI